ncbi:ImmA/IrrE family metallo-endopeptidase [uncultured Bradyrhizobium sp.]|jgi:hypothetical protein|uniref:ImmA/IrrE family metallo-endopeptidase n=1 Tax=uncultured Bradyrhizobium sp. TaxID=199684 RepID=UPI002606AE3C|nr:ImmA/IrrE family metallo-endopeptidase [uncultured Bradyrhizobium sp.]
MALRDHKVRHQSREHIARVALFWWLIADRRGGNSFNICSFVLQVLAKRLRGKGKLQIEFYSPEDLPEGACVTFNPLTLHIVKRIWDDAGAGETYARFIVAHEIGHILLHDGLAVAFSNDNEAVLKFVEEEESAEAQANAFADLFLAPDHVVLRLREQDTIAGLCVVSDAVAKRRLKDALATKHPLFPQYTGDACDKCRSFTLLHIGVLLKCDECGDVTET